MSQGTPVNSNDQSAVNQHHWLHHLLNYLIHPVCVAYTLKRK